MLHSHLPTDVLLLRMRVAPDALNSLRKCLEGLPDLRDLGASPGRCAWLKETGTAYVYLDLPERIALPVLAPESVAGLSAMGVGVELSRLALMQTLDGASHGQHPAVHYAVEMTPQAGWEAELQHWYAREHLPGLAGVPGCVRAQRFLNYDTGPSSLACYDLVDAQAMGSPPWLAVRNTAWSSRVRPRFTATVRTMFSLVD
ncbi:hypothetical protein [Pseudorhodoferax sp. Leaf265]|uniref:hypothetical protein n=1 Tax=Pseudorhodoferax sp. Leaf265 TaxID=1736315 RepID=UPI0006FAFEBD|nr:hypothetical protein [Pseudorhodoferax sp. Leaf265]KQP08845.1 hypothetical protein ASF45_07085 [Pseudorhodoferax sp. Leaf265]